MSVGATKLGEVLWNKFNREPQLLDSNYSLPTKKWFLNDLAQAISNTLVLCLGLHYKINAWDCDKYTRLGILIAQLKHAESGINTALAVGMLVYMPDGSQIKHAIMFAVVEDFDIVFLDPQTPNYEKHLTESELASVAFDGLVQL